jgi:hypothetical protein
MKSIIPPRLEAVIRSRLGASAPSPEDPRWQADRCDPSETRGGTFRPRRRRENDPRASGFPSDGEIVRTLMRYRYDRAFRGERRVPIKTLADCVGLSHETVYQSMRGKISDVTRAKLSWAIVAIADGRLRFRRHRQVWQMEYRHPD